MTQHDDFATHGFLGNSITNGIVHLRAENADWFSLADDTNLALMRIAATAISSVKTNSWAPKAVAARVLLRSCGTFQGVILLTERGMVAEGRTLARSLIESALCVAALHDNPITFIEMLRQDSQASRRQQANFIIEENLVIAGTARDKLQAVVDDFDKKIAIMSPKKVAALGPSLKLYLSYQRLSDDAAHLSARSLDRHLLPNSARTVSTCKLGAGDQGENAATLHHAISAAIEIGVGITGMLNDVEGNAEFDTISRRFQGMPKVPVI